jgi:TatD DNase family protein
MIETDSPYLSPVPFRGQRNEPLRVKEVAKKIAELRGQELSEIEKELWQNSLNFFKIIE